ncbi:uncharacterized protein [Elaeis guineensis]|uniref:uncharacterized protein n=1 Tax=Elaeis guineensis var. tenera TaxID=51953 RepID=UPI003C6CCCA0
MMLLWHHSTRYPRVIGVCLSLEGFSPPLVNYKRAVFRLPQVSFPILLGGISEGSWEVVSWPDIHSTEVEVAEDVLERLQPHHNLKELDIYSYTGTRLPNWMSPSFPNLVELTMGDLKRCEHLPLGPWPSLKKLKLRKMHAVRRIGEEFYGDGGGITFPSLENLTLEDMPDLEKWHAESCPRLTKLEISSCPKLVVQPCIPCSMETLTIRSSNEMLLSAGSLARLSKLKSLEIFSCGISSSSGWWDGLQCLTALEKLLIEECDELTCLPENIMYLPALQTLDLVRNRNLEGEGRKQQQPNRRKEATATSG